MCMLIYIPNTSIEFRVRLKFPLTAIGEVVGQTLFVMEPTSCDKKVGRASVRKDSVQDRSL